MYKLLALDLDGTVLNSKHQINQPLIETIKNLPDDIMVMIVTGRHHTAAKPYYDQLNLTTPIICCNGTYLYDFKTLEVISENSIPKDQALQFLSLCDQYGMKKTMYVTHSMLYDESNPMTYMETLQHWSLQFPEDDRPSIIKISDFETSIRNNNYVWKFVLEGKYEDVAAFFADPFIKTEFSVEQSFFNRFDLARKGNTKGNRLAEYISSMGIHPEQVVAIGDHNNDISMFAVAGMGVTLDHADQVVKQAANVVIDSNNDDLHGLANFINSLFKAPLSDQ
ncbi:MAG: Cof-type HAD-IIB family hydrolase [Psychromonas sp.]